MEASLHNVLWWLAFASIIRDALSFFDFSSGNVWLVWFGSVGLGDA